MSTTQPNQQATMSETPPTPELNLSFDSESPFGLTDEESGVIGSSNKPKSVGFAPTTNSDLTHPLAISSVEVKDAAAPPGHRRDISDLGDPDTIRSRLTVGSSILTSPDTAMHMRTNSKDSNVMEKTDRVRREHVRNVFRGSVTVGTVSYEQIERIKKSEFNVKCFVLVSGQKDYLFSLSYVLYDYNCN